eukprot:TRINITY_DN15266_c0_g1_i1.p1 TRINITY_DN15266_c0_g1~~TRINITY_DN15266_c0_g1_i1.p1  ORF type:complete len:731 (+),score=88.77 TRINITY_DN15266_c0_g1_i1:25-2193(+)
MWFLFLPLVALSLEAQDPFFVVRFSHAQPPTALGSDVLPMVLKGKRWLCQMPQDSADEQPATEQTAVPTSHRVPRQPFEELLGANCFHSQQGWWHYELCFDKWLKQYHEEDSVIHTEFFLGLGTKAFFQDNLGLRKFTYLDGIRPMLAQLPRPLGASLAASGEWDWVPKNISNRAPHYTTRFYDGTLCDLSGKPRETILNVHCSLDPTENNTFSVSEEATCLYSLTFMTSVVCTLPDMAQEVQRLTPPPKVASAIQCYYDQVVGNPEDYSASTGDQYIETPARKAVTPEEAESNGKSPPEPQPVAKNQVDKHFAGHCYRVIEGWWAYEWCYEKWVRQYHEASDVVSAEYYLGLGVNALLDDPIGQRRIKYIDGAKSSLEQLAYTKTVSASGVWVFMKGGLESFYSSVYRDGTLCDVTGLMREIEVRLMCPAENPVDETFTVVEADSCKYILHFQSLAVCTWPEMAGVLAELGIALPPPPARPHVAPTPTRTPVPTRPEPIRTPAEPPIVPVEATQPTTESDPEEGDSNQSIVGDSEELVSTTERIHAAFAGRCYKIQEGWWQYEYCFGKWLKQYHEEGGIVLSEYFLGLGHAALEVDAASKRRIRYPDGVSTPLRKLELHPEPSASGIWEFVPRNSTNQGHHYHTPFYDGTVCEESREARMTDVRLFCTGDLRRNNTLQVVEYKVCRYLLNFYSTVPCTWPEMVEAMAAATTQATAKKSTGD